MALVSRSPRVDGLVCASAVILAILLAYPFAEVGIIDDWSYVKSAQIFSQTGHFVYNGWATAMLGWQIAWGALFIKLFGFSFTAARCSTLISAFVAVFLFNRVQEKFGLSRSSNIFGCLMLGLSPLFIPLAPSFMTDINGVLVVIACLYLCQRALEASSDRSALSWLAAAALVDIFGGTVRQIAWLGVLVMVPSTAWLMRRRRGSLALCACLWLFGVASMFAVTHWWSSVPGSIKDAPVAWSAFTPRLLPHLAQYFVRCVLQLSLILLPLSIAWLWKSMALSSRKRLGVAASIVIVVAFVVLLARHQWIDKIIMPWTFDIVITEVRHAPRNAFSLGVRALFSVLAVFSLVALLFSLRGNQKIQFQSQAGDLASWSVCLTIILPFLAGFALLIVPRLSNFGFADRYLLTILPVLEILLLKLYQDHLKRNLPAASYVILAFFAAYSIVATHDWYSENRADVRAVDSLLKAGIPRSSIQAGWSFDAWTQIETTGYMNDARVQHAPFTPNPEILADPRVGRWLYWAPSVRPVYFVSGETSPDFFVSSFGTFPVDTWLPPYHRVLYVFQESQEKK